MATGSTAQLNILVKVRDEAQAGLRRLSNDASDLGGNLGFAGDAAGTLAGALAGIGAGAIIGAAINAFARGEAQMARFNAIMKTLPPELQKYREEILRVADEALIKFGFDNEVAAVSMARLLQVTGDAPMAFQAFQAAMDLARYRGIDLEQATRMILNAIQGNLGPLRDMGIEIHDMASKQTVLAAVTQRLAGQTEEYSKSLAGQIDIVRQLVGELTDAFGAVFAPVIEIAIGWIRQAITSLGGMQAVINLLYPLIVAFAVALLIVLGFALKATIAAIGGFIAVGGLVLLKIAAISLAIGLFAAIWRKHWEGIVEFFQTMGERIISIWEAITNFITSIFTRAVDAIRAQIQSVIDFANRAASLVAAPVQAVARGAGDIINRAQQVVRNIPRLAEGGIVTRPTLAMIGEAGAEAVIPLNRLRAGGGGGGTTIILQGDFYTDRENAERWANYLAKIINNQIRLAI